MPSPNNRVSEIELRLEIAEPRKEFTSVVRMLEELHAGHDARRVETIRKRISEIGAKIDRLDSD